jgi:putative transposase
MILSNFPKIVKTLFKPLPKNDYPVLDTFTFVSCWIGWVMDQSLVSMRDLFIRLNSRDISIHLSTFSKASKKRDYQVFQKLLERSIKELRKKSKKREDWLLFPIDSTIITLTSKLLWLEGYHQVKLFCGLNNLTSEVGGVAIHFGQGHDSKEGNKTINEIPQNGIGIMDRGFCSLKRIEELNQKDNQYYVLRIKNNIQIMPGENKNYLVGTGTNQVETRVINFCDLEERTEYRLVTNLSEEEMNNEEISEVYRNRWAIETLWKFLKMHLKLDKLMTKNVNGIRIQIYSCLIAYILLQLVEIPPEIGEKALNKLRYLQAFMNEKISYIHWFRQLSLRW